MKKILKTSLKCLCCGKELILEEHGVESAKRKRRSLWKTNILEQALVQ